MDTFSTSVPSFKFPITHQTPSEIHQQRILNSSYQFQSHDCRYAAAAAKPTSISFPSTKLTTSQFPSHSHLTKPLKQTSVHRKASSGYAAALIDAAICNNSLEAMHRDVRRFSIWLKHNYQQLKTIIDDPFGDEVEKGRIIKEVAEKGRYRRQLVVLVNMLVEKNKLGMVGEVLNEFIRIYGELSGTLRVIRV